MPLKDERTPAMKKLSIVVCLLASCFLTGSGVADETEGKKLSAGLAQAALDMLGKGRTDQARELLYKALAHDLNCPVALYELGKMFESEGKLAAAVDFYVRAVVEFAKDEKSNPDWGVKRADARTRIQKLSPVANQYSSIMEEYAQELDKALKKSPDTLTREEVLKRMQTLNLAAVVACEKLPVIEKPVAAPEEDTTSSRRIFRTEDGKRISMRDEKPAPPTIVPPDVERALKAGGWSKITGTWKKKAEKVYEVTDGKLEAAITNGALQVIVFKGGTGSVQVNVRTRKESYYYSESSSYGKGFGVHVTGSTCKVFAPTGGWSSGSECLPYADKTFNLPEQVKNVFLVQIKDTTAGSSLDIIVNNRKERSTNYRVSREGPFTIEIEGTMIIEDPRAAGQ
jgi:hypothetical protein